MIRKLIHTLLALGLFASQATASMNVIDPYKFAVALPSLTFLQCTEDATDLTTYTFTGENVGTASADRHTIVGVVMEDTATVFGVASMTIGGAAATEVVDQALPGDVIANAAFYIMLNTAGTSEDIVVTATEAVTDAAICVWQANNLSSATAVDVAEDAAGTGDQALSLNTSADGMAVGITTSELPTVTTAWTGMTEVAADGTGGFSWSAADIAPTVAETPRTITANWTSGAGAGTSAVSASFR